EDGIRDFHVTGVQTCALPIFGVLRLGVVPSDVSDQGFQPHGNAGAGGHVRIDVQQHGPQRVSERQRSVPTPTDQESGRCVLPALRLADKANVVHVPSPDWFVWGGSVEPMAYYAAPRNRRSTLTTSAVGNAGTYRDTMGSDMTATVRMVRLCSRAQVSARMIARSRGALCSPMGNTPFCASAREERNRYADQGAQRRSGPRGSPHSLLKAIHARFQVFHCLGCPVVGQPLIKTHNQLMERT